MKKMKRLASLLLVTASFFAMSMTSFAEDYTITINKPSSSSITLANHTYEAYQIFSAVLDSAHTDSQEGTLSQIQWGTNANGTAIIEALTGTSAPAALKTAFASCAGVPEAQQAEAVARVLEENPDLAPAFADAAAPTLTGTPVKGAKGDTTLTVTDGPGYYLIKDVDNTLTAAGSEAYTDFILKVVDNVDVTVKADAPTLTKVIDEGEGVEANTASIGDKIPYKVTSKVPDMQGYTKYFFVIDDTMDTGLTFNDDVAVAIGDTTLANDAFEVTKNGQSFKIVLKNFIQYNTEDFIDKPITVTYSATLNEQAKVTTEGNENKAQLTYSNNPNVKPDPDNDTDVPGDHDVYGQTPEDNTMTYTTELKLIKLDNSTGDPLKGAKFSITGEALNAVLINGQVYEKDAEGTYYKLKDGTYTTDGSGDDKLYDSKDQKYSLVESVTKTTDKTKINTEAYTGADGILRFTGLGAGTYEIEEIEAPEGYNKLDPSKITVTIGTDGEVTVSDCRWTFVSNPEGIAEEDGVYTLTFKNSKGIILPGTGGIGTVIFYIIGSAMIAAAIIMVVRKKKTASNK
ncbi:MAG: isopeptide-forming domain-containing fimbrial protein [Oscillospiraceae bacterium]|nr:isopeptide-forming domain-containing fimbrial protein [Oscillospiraceae bacterium]